MNRINLKLTTLFLFIFSLSFSQSPILEFDGVDDYVDLENEVGNEIRTIEMWFKPAVQIDTNLANFSTLIAREASPSDNTTEFVVTFQPGFLINGGSIRFDIDGTEPFKSVYSDNKVWEAGRWYHVAAVVHPVNGMALFIDGVKQSSTHPYTGATASTSDPTIVGKWGYLDIRHFNGAIEDLRISSEALYTVDFIPPCPDIELAPSTVGLWNFNEGAGTVTADLSSNEYDGTISGATWSNDFICRANSISEFEHVNLTVYPNPSNDIFYFNLNELQTELVILTIYDLRGRKIYETLNQNDSIITIDLSDYETGTYVYQATLISGESISGKILLK